MNPTIKRYITKTGIKPGDSLVVNRSLFDSLDPFVLYGGKDDFVFRKRTGLQWLSPAQSTYWLRYHQPGEVNRFLGTQIQRSSFVTQLVQGDEKAYFRLLNLSEYYNPGVEEPKPQKSGDNLAKGVGIALGLGALLLIGGALISSLNEKEDENEEDYE